ncbi:MAG: hypothetical protein KatS3mg105_3633 [Gemmatales bacterium]|nr:MAG: hypothetical protein KatS3mg105_3633 [Gemmatales bacterium]
MPIRVKCTNRECGKVLTVKDELAGKRGKCPACGKILSIPAPVEEDPGFGPPEPVPDDNPFNFEDFSPASETQTEGKTKPKSKPALDGEDEETPTKKSPQRDDKGKRAAKKGTEDADELEDDEEEERPKRKKKKKRSKSALGSDAVMPVALGLGAGMLLCLGISATVLDWITLPTQADIKAIQEKVKNGNAGSETSLKNASSPTHQDMGRQGDSWFFTHRCRLVAGEHRSELPA